MLENPDPLDEVIDLVETRVAYLENALLFIASAQAEPMDGPVDFVHALRELANAAVMGTWRAPT